jgi:hypothetical protein
MPQNDAQDDLQGGFDAAMLPPIDADGAPVLPSIRPVTPVPPRLCEQGPCVSYHRFEIQIEAQSAQADAVAGLGERHGELIGSGGEAFHTQVHHYCYPSPGVDTRLGSLPVIDCNRWRPSNGLVGEERSHYAYKLAKWTSARAADAELQSQVASDAARVIAEMNEPKGK